ncbi:MAG: FMN-binding protein [Pedosphaera sp.]|nr:FMN-binding protein [Pedosphaera sp.]
MPLLLHIKRTVTWGAALLCLCAAGSLRAERYLTIAQAQKLCFPEADTFERRVETFTAEQTRAIEKDSGIAVPLHGIPYCVALKAGRPMGVLALDRVRGKHEQIDYAVAIGLDGHVRQVEILEYRESYGHEVRSTKWRAQFAGKTAADKLRFNDDIYNISGATISCRNVTEGVKRVLASYDLVVRPRVAVGLPAVLPNGTPSAGGR